MRASWVDSGSSAAAVPMPRIATNRASKALVMATSRSNEFRRLRMLSHFPEKYKLLRCVTAQSSQRPQVARTDQPQQLSRTRKTNHGLVLRRGSRGGPINGEPIAQRHHLSEPAFAPLVVLPIAK